MARTTKLSIAQELLEQALRLYFEGGADFAALHLAGAADELLARHVARLGGMPAFEDMRDGAARLTRCSDWDGEPVSPKDIADAMNLAKNEVKHMRKSAADFVVFDPRVQARDILDRAISDYYQLMAFEDLPETELVRRYNLESVKRE